MSPTAEPATELPTRRSVAAGPIVAAYTVTAGLLATSAADVPFRDPDHVVGRRLALVGCLVALLIVLDIAVRAGVRSRRFIPALDALRHVRRERWTRLRAAAVVSALVSFYVTYLAYRNLKSIVPVLRPEESFDRRLGDIDRTIFGGHDPAALMHSALGTGVAAEILAVVYVMFIFFLPLSLALALVFSPDLRGGIFYATALSINWGLGVASYYLLPAMGPIFVTPEAFAELPATEVARLQGLMIEERGEFLRNPGAADASQNIAAFASLHVAMIFTAAVAAHLLGLGRRLRIGLWLLFAGTIISTIYFGWHYVLDDVAGVLIGLLALAIARALTGFQRRDRRRAAQPSARAGGAALHQPQPATRR